LPKPVLEAELRSILSGYRWIKVRQHLDDDTQPWEVRYAALTAHHVAETEFLIAKCRRLAAELLSREADAAVE